MRIKAIARQLRFAMLSIVVFALTTLSMTAQSKDSANVTRLFSEANSDAVQIEHHADTLKSYTNSRLSWKTHASQLEEMRKHVNDLGRTVHELHNARAEGSPWQQEAIDRINPLLQGMADSLTATIKHLNDHQTEIHFQRYRDYTAANYELASSTAGVIKDFVEYGKAKSKAGSLEDELQMPHPAPGS
jgi:endonuclease I